MQSSTRFSARVLVTLCAASFAIGGCGIAVESTYDPYKLYLTTPAPTQVRAELLDRYACAAQTPLLCQCMSRLSDCECRCR